MLFPSKTSPTPLPLLLVFSFVWLWVLLLCVGDWRFVKGAPADAEVKQFPGYNGSMPSKHYAGYITLDNEGYKSHLYYYFATSERNPFEDPVTLFINGGPGCSLFSGIVHLFGPFELEKNADYMISGTKVKLKPFSWTKVSNMLFVDSPVGAGYSYSEVTQMCDITSLDSSVASQHSYIETSDAYTTDDTKTIADLYNFVLKWFSEFPEFLSNPLYLSGSSYAGVYVPVVAQEIVNGIEAGNGPNINFKGYSTGNAAIDVDIENRGKVPFAHRMGLISDELYMNLTSSCNGKFWNNHHPDCLRNMETFQKNIIGIDEYHILFLPCHYEMGLSIPSYEQDSIMAYQRLRDSIEDNIYCYDYNERPRMLFNLQSSREILHAMPVEVTGEWARCTKRLHYKRNLYSVIPYHMNLTMKGYRAFIYSGDHDMVIPPSTNLEWIKMLNYTVIEKWRPWFVEDQIAGYTVQYDHNLLFATFRGAGHTVTEYMPREALIAYERWIGGSDNL